MRWLAGLTVAAVAGIAGVISYTHIRTLAEAHGYAGTYAMLVPFTMATYVHPTQDRMRDAADALAALYTPAKEVTA